MIAFISESPKGRIETFDCKSPIVLKKGLFLISVLALSLTFTVLSRFHMQELLRKYKVIDDLTIQLTIDKADFIQKFRQHVEPGDTGIIGNPFEVFSSSDQEFRGQVDLNGFVIRKRRKMFEPYANIAKAEGTFHQDQDKLRITTTVNAFNGMFLFYYVFVTFVYLAFTVVIIAVEDIPVFVIPFLLLHAALMYGIPFFLMRGGVKRMKRDLEREFFYMTKS